MREFTPIARAFAALQIDVMSGVQIVDAAAIIPQRATWPSVDKPSDGAWSEIQGVGPYVALVQPFPLLATRAALLGNVDTVDNQALVQALGVRYPASHPVVAIAGDQIVWRGTLEAWPSFAAPPEALLFLAPLDPLQDLWSADGPQTVMTRLLGPQGCPWDREQTHRSLRKDLLGETHEVLEAIDIGEPDALAEELGDLLLQVLIHTEIARQAGEFTLEDVHHHLASKLIRRHPHVFGSLAVDGSDTVLRNWDAIKQAERATKGQAPRGTLDGIPVSLPALSLAQETLKKAAKAGFDADTMAWDWAKLQEEVAEFTQAVTHENDQRRIEEEFGDMLLTVVKLARRFNIEAESALREAVGKFRRRFDRLEAEVANTKRDLKTMDEAEKLALWDAAKQQSGIE